MKIIFKLDIEFSITTSDAPLGAVEQTYDAMVKIKTFIQEFFKHPSVVKAYYRSLFMDEYIDHTANQWDELATLLNYLPDYGPLFVEVAKNCPPEVAKFIDYLFSEDTDDKAANIDKELHRRILEDELRNLKLTKAVFTKLNP